MNDQAPDHAEFRKSEANSESKESFLAAMAAGALFASERPEEPLGEESGNIAAGEFVGPYKLVDQVGEGGFGEVWKAEQIEPVRREVALKLIKEGMDSKQVILRFEGERQALAKMNHPNIAKVFDAGTSVRGRPYFVMEFVEGVPITEFCDHQKLRLRQRLELFRDVCSAVNHAHQKGIVHRDVKPSNVIVALDGERPAPKVIDFGIAKAIEDKLTDQTLFTRHDQLLGTPVYMSPEQAALSGVDIDTRSDIYSLGVLLYEMLAGQPPFDSKTLLAAGYDEMRRMIREVDPPKPSTSLVQAQSGDGERRQGALITSGNLEGELDWIVMKAIEKDRAQRYETANAFAADIGRYLSNEPVLAAAPSAVYRFRKFARRNKVALGVASGFVLLLCAATVVSSALAIRATKEKARAELAENKAVELLGLSEKARRQEQEARKEAEDIGRFSRRVLRMLEEMGVGRHSLYVAAGEFGKRYEYDEAIKLFERVLEYQSEPTAFDYILYSALLIHLDRMEEYATLRNRILGDFENTSESGDLDAATRAALLASVDDRSDRMNGRRALAAIRRWAKEGGVADEDFGGWLRLSMGMAFYRIGALEEASEWLDQAVRHRHETDYNTICLSFRAMVRHRMGHEGAVADLKEAQGMYLQLHLGPRWPQGSDRWWMDLAAHLVLKQALEVVEGTSSWLPDLEPVPADSASSAHRVVISMGSSWRWLHPVDGRDPADSDADFHSTFHKMKYDDSMWQTGTDPEGGARGFGYGDAVAVHIGQPSEGNRHSAYFRCRFTARETYRGLELRCQRDDGIIVYLDGVEVARDNVGDGEEAYRLYSSSLVGNDAETETVRVPLAGVTLAPGEHVLAISLHNASENSSDLRLAEVSLVVGADLEESAP